MINSKTQSISIVVVTLLIAVLVFASHSNVEAQGFTTQNLRLKEGFNRISLFVAPNSYQVADVFAPLVDNGELILVKNGAGEVYWPEYGINQIGQMSPEEGYEVAVWSDTILNVQGDEIELPFTINLNAGWNLISYPKRMPENVMSVMQELINNETLVAVKDPNNNWLIQENGVWVDNISKMRAGSGYYIYVTQPTALIVQ